MSRRAELVSMRTSSALHSLRPSVLRAPGLPPSLPVPLAALAPLFTLGSLTLPDATLAESLPEDVMEVVGEEAPPLAESMDDESCDEGWVEEGASDPHEGRSVKLEARPARPAEGRMESRGLGSFLGLPPLAPPALAPPALPPRGPLARSDGDGRSSSTRSTSIEEPPSASMFASSLTASVDRYSR